jgi:hypothetical protein
MTQDFIRANTIRDSNNSAGSASQVLTAGLTGSSLSWTTVNSQFLGTLLATPTASAFQNQLVMYNTSTNALTYDSLAYSCIVQVVPATITPTSTMRGRTFIVTSTGAQNLTLNTTTLGTSDVGFFVKIKNGNGTNGGDITIVGATGNTVVHNQTSTQNGQQVILYWNGTAMIAY